MPDHGYFSGNPKTEWLVDANGKDRDMRLLEDFSYTDPRGRVWLAPKDAVVNGASIPRLLWVKVGSPYTDDYRRASVVHDVACDTPGVDRKEADEMFHDACRAGGCNRIQARILYAGVRIGAWSSKSLASESWSREKALFREPFSVALPEEMFMQQKLEEISLEMSGLSDECGIEEMDEIIERHIKF